MSRYFEDYMREAFKPLGVYINFFHPHLEAGGKQRLRVMALTMNMIAAKGTWFSTLTPAGGGAEAVRQRNAARNSSRLAK